MATKMQEQYKGKSINDLFISDKFNIIAEKFGDMGIDYKNREWLQQIYDGADLLNNEHTSVCILTKNGVTKTSINFENDIVCIESEYESDGVSGRIDSMLNALVIFLLEY